MKPEPITWKTWGLALFLLACLVAALAICGGACGTSDLEMFQRAAEPFNL